jgi:glycosyltransferase involved in cell wall biosynthesis
MTPDSSEIRVLHILPSFGVGGAEQMAAHLMTGISRTRSVAAAGLYSALNTTIEHRLTAAGVDLWHLNKRLGFDPRMFPALDRVVRCARPHVVHTHMSVLRYAFPGLLRRGVPVVVHTLHNLAEHETDAFGRILNWFAFRGRVIPVAISREVASSMERVYGLQCRAIVPNGIPVDRYLGRPEDRIQWRTREHFAQDAILFTCVGRLAPQKNPMLLVRAFAALQDPRAHLVMLGEGILRDELLAFVSERRLADRVHFLGKRMDIPECLAASDVFVLSSNWEGNPLAVMEAMAAGLPVIGTRVGGVPELVESGQHGILVDPGDDAAFAEAMRTLLNDVEKRLTMAEAARLRAKEAFDVKSMVRGYMAIYEAALAGAVTPVVAAAA